MLGPPKTRDLDRPVLTSLEAAIPHDLFYRHLERTLDLAFVRDLVADCYAGGGRPSIDPVVFFNNLTSWTQPEADRNERLRFRSHLHLPR